jgi:hypothetical protein
MAKTLKAVRALRGQTAQLGDIRHDENQRRMFNVIWEAAAGESVGVLCFLLFWFCRLFIHKLSL